MSGCEQCNNAGQSGVYSDAEAILAFGGKIVNSVVEIVGSVKKQAEEIYTKTRKTTVRCSESLSSGTRSVLKSIDEFLQWQENLVGYYCGQQQISHAPTRITVIPSPRPEYAPSSVSVEETQSTTTGSFRD